MKKALHSWKRQKRARLESSLSDHSKQFNNLVIACNNIFCVISVLTLRKFCNESMKFEDVILDFTDKFVDQLLVLLEC